MKTKINHRIELKYHNIIQDPEFTVQVVFRCIFINDGAHFARIFINVYYALKL